MNNLSSRFAWLKKKELGLPLGVWAVVLAAVILFIWRRRQSGSGSLLGSSTNPNGADALGNAPTSGGASDGSDALAGIANEIALETQLLTNVLDKLQGKKKKKKPHKHKHHPKHHKAPTTHKTPVAHHHKHKHKRVKPKHKRSGVSAGGGGSKSVLNAIKARTHTSTTMKVRPGGIFKHHHSARFPRQHHLGEPLAHPRSELHPGTEHVPHNPDRSFTRGPATVAKHHPLPANTEPRKTVHHHPASTKPRKH
jgi:hypothetical protein